MTPTLTTPARTARGRNESGMALLSTLLVMMLMSALLVGFFAMVASDQRASGSNRDQTRAYAAAHAGLEKLTSDLGLLFTGGNSHPSVAELAALTATPPSLPGFEDPSPLWHVGLHAHGAARPDHDDPVGRVPGARGPDHAVCDQRHRARDRW